jgi:hypothetical protein
LLAANQVRMKAEVIKKRLENEAQKLGIGKTSAQLLTYNAETIVCHSAASDYTNTLSNTRTNTEGLNTF